MGYNGQSVKESKLPVVPPVDLSERLHNKFDDGKSHDELERIRNQPPGYVGRIFYYCHDRHFEHVHCHIQIMNQFPACFSHLILPAPRLSL